MCVDKQIYLKCRIETNRLDYKRKVLSKPNLNTLWREYYSIRNLLYIYKTNQLYYALVRILFIKLLKSVLVFKYGFKIGLYTMKITFLAIFHFVVGAKGKKIMPLKK